MPDRTTLTVQNIARTGLAPAYAAASAAGTGDKFSNDGRTVLHVKNTNGAGRTITIQTPGTIDGLAIPERTVAIGATTGDKKIGPFPTQTYNQTDGCVYVDLDAEAGVTIAAIRLP